MIRIAKRVEVVVGPCYNATGQMDEVSTNSFRAPRRHDSEIVLQHWIASAKFAGANMRVADPLDDRSRLVTRTAAAAAGENSTAWVR
jgi:hypothetical protein